MKRQLLALSIALATGISALWIPTSAAMVQPPLPSVPMNPPPQVEEQVEEPSSKPLSVFEALLFADLAYACAAAGDYESAIPLYKRVLPTIRDQIGPDSAVYVDVTGELAASYANTDQMALAEQVGQESFIAAKNCKYIHDCDRAVIANNLGYVRYRLHKYDQARQSYQYALSHLKVTDNAEGLLYAMCEANFADLEAAQKRTADAMRRYKHARRIFRRELQMDSPLIAEINRKLSALQHEANRIAKRK